MINVNTTDLTIPQARELMFQYVQLKYDGIFGYAVSSQGVTTVYSKTGNIKAKITTPNLPTCVMLGELLIGSTWSKDRKDYGYLYVFDFLRVKNQWIGTKPFSYRMAVAHEVLQRYPSPKIKLCNTFSINEADVLWSTNVNGPEDFEGLVFKDDRTTITEENATLILGRCKKTVTYDYILMGVNQEIAASGAPKAQAGSIRVGLWNGSGIIEVMSVAGICDDMKQKLFLGHKQHVGKVVEITGRKLFPSGALRHPSFVRFHSDKHLTQCTFDSLNLARVTS